jgi:DNA-binding MltR family transcriptional regulator
MPRRPPLPPESLSADSKHLYDLLNEGTDASVIIIGVSYIDACLASLLAKRLLKSSVTEKLLDSRSGAIGSFAARSDLAYTLSLIDKPMYQDLLVLAGLRNETAHHHFELSFASGAILQGCDKLKYVACLKAANTGGPLIEEAWLARPRDRFMLTATMIVNRLLLTALCTTHVE